jgi:magnesium-transporting ATPase (P-type)
MITGDHAITARAIAEKLRSAERATPVMTGSDLEKISDADLPDPRP